MDVMQKESWILSMITWLDKKWKWDVDMKGELDLAAINRFKAVVDAYPRTTHIPEFTA